MDKYLQMVIDLYNSYWISPIYIILFIASVIYIILNKRCNKVIKRVLAVYSIAVLVLFTYNPGFIIALPLLGSSALGGVATFVRFMYLVPIYVVYAYAIVLFVYTIKKAWIRVIICISFVAIFVIWGQSLYYNGAMSLSSNVYHMEDTGIELSNIIKRDMEDDSTSEVDVIIDYQNKTTSDMLYVRNENPACTIRQYLPNIVVVGGVPKAAEVKKNTQVFLNYIKNQKKAGYTCDYMISPDNEAIPVYTSNGYKIIGEAGSYLVLKAVSNKEVS